MADAHSLRKVFVDSPRSLGQRTRTRRWSRFEEVFPLIAEMNVVDLGGTVDYWLRAPVKPRSVHVINLDGAATSDVPEWVTVTIGDACHLPESVADREFDLVYSNSVLEHVGGHEQRRLFVANVERLAPQHWIQTPYRYFPVEPHWVCPLLQFLPLRLRASVGYRWPLVHTRPADRAEALEALIQVELLSATQMEYYFPRSTLERERVAGITKSLIAVLTKR